MFLQGIFPPITTPFYSDGRVYLKKLEHNVERYSKTPVAGIVVLGSTGEAIMLSDEERREVLKTAREACAPHKVLIAGTGAESAVETLKLTEYAADLGYDAALVRNGRGPLAHSGADLQRSSIHEVRHAFRVGYRTRPASEHRWDQGVWR